MESETSASSGDPASTTPQHPVSAPVPAGGTLVFRMRWLPLFGSMSFVTLPLLVGLVALRDSSYLGDGRPWIVLGVAAVALAVAAWVMVWSVRVQVSGDGITGPDFYGRRLTLSFDALSDVKPFRLPWIPFARLVSEDERDLWLPMFLSEEQDFFDAVCSHVGEDHPTRGWWAEQRARRS